MKPTVTIIIPAYNEEEGLANSVKLAKKAIKEFFRDYEIFIFDDCSTDKTGLIADELSKIDKKIKVIHNKKNMGPGYNYTEGVKLAKKDYVVEIHGDNESTISGIKEVLKYTKKADIIIPYPPNPEIRAIYRRVISKSFTFLMNILTGLNLKYYNGTSVYKTNIIKKIDLKTFGFIGKAEAVSKLLKTGRKFIEVEGMELKKRKGKSKIFKLKSIIQILKEIIYLIWILRIKKRKKYNKIPVKINE